MTGQELQQLLQQKWGVSYDVQLRRVRGQIFLQIMWRYLEQASFPMTQSDYLAHLNAIVEYLNGWGNADTVQQVIETTREKPRVGKAVSIPLELGERASEWLL
ncbi:MAG: DUF3067 family protein [Microcoleaceae cyanobacterium]